MKPRKFRQWLALFEDDGLPRFFHGTSQRYLPAIRQHGLLAAPTKPKSGPVRRGIYLTDDYQHAADYAELACALLPDGRNDELLILEVIEPLNARLLEPDDYDLHDAIQGGEQPGTEPIDDRLKHLTRWQEADWRLSLAVTHQVFYAGSIPLTGLRIVLPRAD